MKKKLWFYLFWIQLGLTLVILIHTVPGQVIWSTRQNDVASYLEEQLAYRETYGNFVPEDGYIPDANTAAKVGGAIIDAYLGDGYKGIPLGTTVEYDAENRLWKVRKSYFPTHGGDVVIDQDTGTVLDIVLYK